MLNDRYITFVQHNSYDTTLPDNSVDYLFSMATIEHLDEPHRSIAEWKRIMKPGAISAPVAVTVDHRDMSKPFEHLKVEASEWPKLFGFSGYHPSAFFNQWRPIDFKQAFEAAGFEIVDYSTNEFPSAYLQEQAREHYPNRKISAKDWEQIPESIRKGHSREEVEKIFIKIVVRKPR